MKRLPPLPQQKGPKLRYIAAGTFVSVSVSSSVAALVLGLQPLALFVLGGLGLGAINFLTFYWIRKYSEYEW
jgi:hypothetical protein